MSPERTTLPRAKSMNGESRTIQRIHFCVLVGVLITSALSPGASKILAADNRPNIIFVVTDDQRCSKKSPQQPPSGGGSADFLRNRITQHWS